MKRLAVVGISSYLARYVEKALQPKGWSVGLMGQRPFTRKSLEEDLRRIDPTHVLNCVGVIYSDNAADFEKWNVEFSTTLMSLAGSLPRPPRKIVLIGSAAEYGCPEHNPVTEEMRPNPVSPYGFSKAHQTEVARNARLAGLPVQVARVFNFIGPASSPVLAAGNFLQQVGSLLDGGVVETGPLAAIRDYLDVRDVAHALESVLNSEEDRLDYNICSGIPLKMRDLLNEMIRLSGKSLTVHEKNLGDQRNATSEIFGDSTRIRSLGWKPKFDLQSTLRFALGLSN